MPPKKTLMSPEVAEDPRPLPLSSKWLLSSRNVSRWVHGGEVEVMKPEAAGRPSTGSFAIHELPVC